MSNNVLIFWILIFLFRASVSVATGRTLIKMPAALKNRLIQIVIHAVLVQDGRDVSRFHALQICQVARRIRAYLIQISLDVIDIMGQQL